MSKKKKQEIFNVVTFLTLFKALFDFLVSIINYSFSQNFDVNVPW